MEIMEWFYELEKKYKVGIVVTLILIIVIAGTTFIRLDKKEVVTKEPLLLKNEVVKEKDSIVVDIKGAVVNPGVYTVEENSTVKSVIDKSGGLTDVSDTTYINMSKRVKDEMVIIIYTKEEIQAMKEGKENVVVVEGKCSCPSINNDGCIKKESTITNSKNDNQPGNNKGDSQIDNNGMVNINTATMEQLLTLTGIGPSKAEDILSYRNEHDGFKKIEDIMEVKGIGTATFNKIKDRLTIS